MSTLVTFFSAEGTTKAVATEFANKIGAELFEIVPEEPYTKADINYMNPLSRCNREQMGKKDVATVGTVENFDKYDTVYVGFPIWYAAAPRVVYSFCKKYNWTGKKVYAFATSGGSGIGKTAEKLSEYVDGAASVEAKLVHAASEIENW
jgi:flavodoxin